MWSVRLYLPACVELPDSEALLPFLRDHCVGRLMANLQVSVFVPPRKGQCPALQVCGTMTFSKHGQMEEALWRKARAGGQLAASLGVCFTGTTYKSHKHVDTYVQVL